MPVDPSFTVHTPDGEADDHLVVALAGPGVAGLTALDYLVEHVETAQIGHVSTRGLPDLTPFTDGQPRRPVRVYDAADSEVTLLGSEVFIPVGVAELFADAVAEWAGEAGVETVTVLHGGIFPHEEGQHAVFGVGTDAYRERYVVDTAVGTGETDGEGVDADEGEIPTLAGGFFDGVVAELLTRAMDGALPPTGVLVTPAHPPGPDLDVALHLLDGVVTVTDLDVDPTALRERSDELRAYYGELSERMEQLREGDGARDYPEDRMYM
jgi:uncharacterized protein